VERETEENAVGNKLGKPQQLPLSQANVSQNPVKHGKTPVKAIRSL